ncbi:hypothetical protein Clacol_001024 [Clathrus columnatus]|uniref:Uncharacterized protein n=1 Tax=Clathrus columnatus TaxID=1419009 RepID=A0AAV5A008_9AGAM|nr:hypothetical protein Clacol_001024 [Clathrus columnatus]
MSQVSVAKLDHALWSVRLPLQDPYHTLYNLARLSIAQHCVHPIPSECDWTPQLENLTYFM